jgi:hypothetical protein
MVGRINKKTIVLQLIINLTLSSGLVMLLWYCRGYVEGVWFELGLILFTPTFYVLVLIKGVNYTMHFISEKVILTVSFTIYAVIIAVLQVAFHRIRKQSST